MTKIESHLDEIAEFLSTWRPAYPDAADKAVRSKLKSSYKQFHALLIWSLVVEPSAFSEDMKKYFTECLSDISHSYFLNLCSLYKSSRSSLRSSIENSIRVLLLDKDCNIEEIKSVYELFTEIKCKHKSDLVIVNLINKLQYIYKDLCESVHSANINYLAKTVPFENLSAFDMVQFSGGNEKIREAASLINQCLFCIWDKRLTTIGHVNADLVRDAIPRSLKRHKLA